MSVWEKNATAAFSCVLDRLFVEKPAACSIKKQRAASVNSLPPWLIPSPRYSPKSNVSYWLSGLKVRMPASVLEQAPAGSTRTTASSSAQKPRMPVWLIASGTARPCNHC